MIVHGCPGTIKSEINLATKSEQPEIFKWRVFRQKQKSTRDEKVCASGVLLGNLEVFVKRLSVDGSRV